MSNPEAPAAATRKSGSSALGASSSTAPRASSDSAHAPSAPAPRNPPQDADAVHEATAARADTAAPAASGPASRSPAPPAKNPTPSPAAAWLDPVRNAAADFFPLSITARLSLSFVAVAVLAATANLIAQKSVSVIRFAMRPEAVQAAPPPAIELPALPPPPIEAPTFKPVEAPKVPLLERKQIEAITAEVDQLQRSGEARASAFTDASEEQYREAERALRRSSGGIGRGASRNLPEAAAVTRRAADYLDGASELVAAADERRAARTEYVKRSEAIAGRLQGSLDGAFKIFGRVIARQSLLDLRGQFDALNHAAAALNSGDTLSADESKAIAEREHSFAQTLAANRTAYVKAEGAPWVQGIEDDLHGLTELRERILALNTRREAAESELSRRRMALSSALLTASTTLVAAPASVAPRPSAATTPSPVAQAKTSVAPAAGLVGAARAPAQASVPAQASAAATRPATAPAAGPAPTPTPTPGPTSTSGTQVRFEPAVPAAGAPAPAATVAALGDVVTETRGLDRRTRNVMGAVTAGVMLIIAVISIITVRSVLAPVRRMIKATSKLADGESRVKVERGGIRELDALAGTFNDMAEKLAAAREANRHTQAHLEAKVVERTHQLQTLAQQDPLTSLPNRRHLTGLLVASLQRAAQDGRYVGVYFIDIDNFKNFNDSLGHAFGDRMLMSVANRLEEAMEGLGYVARLGGDEFTFIHEGAESVEAIQEAGVRLVQAFQSLVSVDDRELRISVSVGASIFPDHDRTPEGLLRAADSALFHAKELGRNQLAVFRQELSESAAARFTTEQGLRRALERGELELVFQPEVNLATMDVELVEALLRWRRPDGRLASPGEFLAVAEQSGLIAEINAWVLREAVQSAARWHLGGWPEARIAVNISSRQLLDHGFLEHLEGLLQEFQLPRHCIELELTETVLQTGPRTVAALRTLRDRGFAITLDDFGTGYSSLTSLEQLPLSRIKLDRSLVESVDSSARAASIVRAILDLCAGLGLAVTAEGIERPEQLAWLAATRNLFVQGYLLSKGIPFDDIVPARARLAARVQDLLLSTPIGGRTEESAGGHRVAAAG